MKIRFIIIAILVFCIAIYFVGCLFSGNFDPTTEGVIDIAVVSDFEISYYEWIYHHQKDNDDYPLDEQNPPDGWYSVAAPYGIFGEWDPNNLRTKKIEEFTPEDTKIYTFVPGGIAEFDRFGHAYSHYVADDPQLFDESGNIVPMTEELSDVIDGITKLSDVHALFLCQIFEAEGEYFVYMELNVNWFYPCELYYYDQAEKRLKYLCQLDNERIVGIRIRNIDKIRSQPAREATKSPPREKSSEGNFHLSGTSPRC